MGNIVITNNGNPVAVPEIQEDFENGIPYQAAQPADPYVLVTSISGFSKTLKPGECVGLDPSLIYTVSTQ